MTNERKRRFNTVIIGVNAGVAKSYGNLYILVKDHNSGIRCAQCAFNNRDASCAFNPCGMGGYYIKMNEESARREREKRR